MVLAKMVHDAPAGGVGSGSCETSLEPWAPSCTSALRVGGSFWTLYSFEREELYEIRNRTVHAFMARALVPEREGYTLYLAIYVKSGHSLTPVYMWLIDPFRRLFVYPDMMNRAQRAWKAKWGDRAAFAVPSRGASSHGLPPCPARDGTERWPVRISRGPANSRLIELTHESRVQTLRRLPSP